MHEVSYRFTKHWLPPRSLITLPLIAMLSIMLSGCGLFQKAGIAKPTPLEDQPYTLNLRLSASETANPNNQGRPSPLLVRVFMSAPDPEINSSTFEKVFDLNNQTMNPRPMQAITIRPGEVRDVVLQLNKSQTQLMIAAAYRDPHQAIWKAAAIISPTKTVNASATLGDTQISIEPGSR